MRFLTGDNRFIASWHSIRMVTTTKRDGVTWYECEDCGMLFDSQEDAKQHEANCDTDSPSYLQ